LPCLGEMRGDGFVDFVHRFLLGFRGIQGLRCVWYGSRFGHAEDEVQQTSQTQSGFFCPTLDLETAEHLDGDEDDFPKCSRFRRNSLEKSRI